MNLAALDSRWRRLWHRVLDTSKTAVRHGVDFILPPSCLCCGRETAAEFCPTCRAELCPPPGPQCARCAAPVGPYLDTAQGCIHCQNDRFRFERVIRLGVYKNQLRWAVLQAKSATGEALTRALADLLFAAESDALQAENWDVIVPVPHHWTRRFRQHHAASEALAEQLAGRLQLPCDRGLVRKTRATPQQAGCAPSIRRRQQRGAFRARDARGLRVLLVDDVLTTGATADEISKTLKAAGAASITVAVLARGLGEHG